MTADVAAANFWGVFEVGLCTVFLFSFKSAVASKFPENWCKGDSKWNFLFWAAGPEDVEGQYFCHGNLRVMKILHTRGWFDGLMRQLSFLSLDDHRMSAEGS